MTDHTPEPWALRTEQGIHKIVGPHHPAIGGPPVAFNCVYGRGVGHQEAIDECAANAARIVACVNACAGIPTERLGDVTLQRLTDLLIRVHNTASLDPELETAVGVAIAPFHGED